MANEARTAPVHAWEHAPTHRAISKWERLAYERHAEDLRAGAERGLWFDDAAALRAITFAESYCHHWKGELAGELVVLEPWERFVIGALFGWKRADGSRRYRTCYLQMARKNGKTFLLAIIGLLLLFADGEAGAEVYCAATKLPQAKRAFDDAAAMVRKAPKLLRHAEVYGGRRNSRTNLVYLPRTGSYLEPLAADSETEDGLHVHGGLVDELHAHKDGGMWETLETGTRARRQPLMVAITTPGNRQDGPCWAQRHLAGQVLDGTVTGRGADRLFAYICEPAAELDWTDPATIEQGNPNLGVSVRLDDVLDVVDEVKHSPARQAAIRQKTVGQWVTRVAAWLSADAWHRCGGPVDPGILRGRTAYAGLDLASIADLCSFDLAFPPDPEDAEHPWTYLLSWSWIPVDSLTNPSRPRAELELLEPWVEDGYIEATPGDVTDYNVIRERMNEARNFYDIPLCGFDPWNAQHLASDLQEVDGWELVRVTQGVAGMSGPSKAFERLVRGGLLRHGDNPVLSWAAGNVAVWEDSNGNIKPSRKLSTGRIDPVVAGVIAVGLAEVADTATGSVYDHRGMVTL